MFNIFKKKPTEEVAKIDAVAAVETAAEIEQAPSVRAESAAKAEPAAKTEPAVNTEPAVKVELSFTQRLKAGLSKTRNLLGSQLNALFGGGKIDAETYDELETILLTSDIGVAATQKLLDNLKKRVKRENLEDTAALKNALKTELLDV